MTDKPYHPPREGDLPRDELCQQAQKTLEDWPEGTVIYFKFTCKFCGERCTLQEPNKLYENGECCSCGMSTPIQFGGFTIQHTTKHENQENKETLPDCEPD